MPGRPSHREKAEAGRGDVSPRPLDRDWQSGCRHTAHRRRRRGLSVFFIESVKTGFHLSPLPGGNQGTLQRQETRGQEARI